MTDTKKDPLDGFHFDDFDPDLKRLTIRIHEAILENPSQRAAFIQRLTEVLAFDDSISGIDVTPRD